MLAYVEPAVGGVDDIYIVKDIRIMEACNGSFNNLVDGLRSPQSGTVESVVACYDGGV